MSAFFMRDMNKVIAEIAGAKVNRVVWKSYVSTVYMDLTFMKELVESLLADGQYNLCNSDFAQ